MAAAKTVAFAESPVTVHVTLASEPGVLPDGSEAWDIESKVMLTGETLPLAVMPPYLRDAVKSGKVPGLIAMTEVQAKKASDYYQQATGIGRVVVEEEEQAENPDLSTQET